MIRLRNESGSILRSAHVLVATYKDHRGREYLTYCRSNTNHIFQKHWFYTWRGNKNFDRKELKAIYIHLHNGPIHGNLQPERY